MASICCAFRPLVAGLDAMSLISLRKARLQIFDWNVQNESLQSNSSRASSSSSQALHYTLRYGPCSRFNHLIETGPKQVLKM